MEETIGQRIRRARMWRGLRQAELARMLDISANSLNAIEKGHTKSPKAETVCRVAIALDVDGDFLLGLNDELASRNSARKKKGVRSGKD